MACPICKKDTAQTYRPFCSKRCADIDLGRWMRGGYVIEGSDDPVPAFDRHTDQKDLDSQ